MQGCHLVPVTLDWYHSSVSPATSDLPAQQGWLQQLPQPTASQTPFLVQQLLPSWVGSARAMPGKLGTSQIYCSSLLFYPLIFPLAACVWLIASSHQLITACPESLQLFLTNDEESGRAWPSSKRPLGFPTRAWRQQVAHSATVTCRHPPSSLHTQLHISNGESYQWAPNQAWVGGCRSGTGSCWQ